MKCRSALSPGIPIGPGVYQINGMTGSIPNYKETPLNEIFTALNPGEINGADNLLFASQPYVDAFGINFLVSEGSVLALAHDDLGCKIVGCMHGSFHPGSPTSGHPDKPC